MLYINNNDLKISGCSKLTIIEKLFVVFYQKEEVETKRITRVKEEGIQLVTF